MADALGIWHSGCNSDVCIDSQAQHSQAQHSQAQRSQVQCHSAQHQYDLSRAGFGKDKPVAATKQWRVATNEHQRTTNINEQLRVTISNRVRNRNQTGKQYGKDYRY